LPNFIFTVDQKPIINITPITQIKNVGESISYYLSPSGGSSFSYQWSKDYIDITNATNSVYEINDRALDRWVGLTQQEAHELAIRTGIEMLLAAGCTLETDDTVSRELARIKACAEVV
jgi:hypothetical protein